LKKLKEKYLKKLRSLSETKMKKKNYICVRREGFFSEAENFMKDIFPFLKKPINRKRVIREEKKNRNYIIEMYGSLGKTSEELLNQTRVIRNVEKILSEFGYEETKNLLKSGKFNGGDYLNTGTTLVL